MELNSSNEIQVVYAKSPLSGVVLTNEIVLTKTRCQSLDAIKRLNCWACKLVNVDIVEQMPNLDVASLSVNLISTLRPFRKCKKLHELYVRKNLIANINEICYLRNLEYLRNLWLADNPCSPASPVSPAASPSASAALTQTDEQRLRERSYRLAVIRALPHLEILDNMRISEEERADAEQLGEELRAPADLLEEEALQHQEDQTDGVVPSAPAADRRFAWSETGGAHSDAHSSKITASAATPQQLLAEDGANNEHHVDDDDLDPQTYWETVARFTDSLPDVDAVSDSGDASTNSGRVRRKRNAPKAGSKLAAAAESANITNRPLPALVSPHRQPEPTADPTISVRDEESAQKEAPARDAASDAVGPHRRSQSFTHKQQHTQPIDAAATSSAVDMSLSPDFSPSPHRYRSTSGSETHHHHKHQNVSASPSSYSTNTSPTKQSEESTGSTSTQSSSPKKEPIRSPLLSVLDPGAGSIGANSAGARAARRARIADPSRLNAPVMPSSISLMPLLRKQHKNHQHEHQQQQQETGASAAASESRQTSGTSESSDAADSTLHNVSEMLDVSEAVASVRSQPQPQAPTALPACAALPVTAACTTTDAAAVCSSASASHETAVGEPLSRLQAGLSLSIGGGRMMRSQSGSSVIGAMLLLLDTLTLDELREVRAAVDERISRTSEQDSASVDDNTIA